MVIITSLADRDSFYSVPSKKNTESFKRKQPGYPIETHKIIGVLHPYSTFAKITSTNYKKQFQKFQKKFKTHPRDHQLGVFSFHQRLF